jgi:hypothetical protein
VSTGENQFLAMCGCLPVGRPRQMQFPWIPSRSTAPSAMPLSYIVYHLSRSTHTHKTRDAKVLIAK